MVVVEDVVEEEVVVEVVLVVVMVVVMVAAHPTMGMTHMEVVQWGKAAMLDLGVSRSVNYCFRLVWHPAAAEELCSH